MRFDLDCLIGIAECESSVWCSNKDGYQATTETERKEKATAWVSAVSSLIFLSIPLKPKYVHLYGCSTYAWVFWTQKRILWKEPYKAKLRAAYIAKQQRVVWGKWSKARSKLACNMSSCNSLYRSFSCSFVYNYFGEGYNGVNSWFLSPFGI